MQLNSVVLPAPLGPIRPTMRPGATSKETPSSATMPPKRTATSCTRSSACPARAANASSSALNFTELESFAMHLEDLLALYELPFAELVHRAQTVHRQHFDPAEVQLSTLLSVKTGGCPEDCAYCPQSRRYDTGVREEQLDLATVLESAAAAKAHGATRFCMGAAWRGPKERDLA